jgi:hypothetical protein
MLAAIAILLSQLTSCGEHFLISGRRNLDQKDEETSWLLTCFIEQVELHSVMMLYG